MTVIIPGTGDGIVGSRADFTLFGAEDRSSNPSIANLTSAATLHPEEGLSGKWGAGLGVGAVLTYSVNRGDGQSYYLTDYAKGANLTYALGLNEDQRAAVRDIQARWAAVADIRFVEVRDSSTEAGDIRWSNTENLWLETAEVADFAVPAAEGGDIWIGPHYEDFLLPIAGQYGHLTLLHELGHALGLNHPHHADPAAPAVPGEDQLKYSVMSYLSYANAPRTGYTTDYFPVGPMINDIQAMQFLYGANTHWRAGDTIYQWAPDQVVFETLWDAGGRDTLSAEGQTQACLLNLNSGEWSWIGPAFYNGSDYVRDCLTIAHGAVIENAVGSDHDDWLIGNGIDNVLDGGAGSDLLAGGAGNDTYRVDRSRDQVREYSGGGEDTVIAAASYTLGRAVENLVLTGAGALWGTGNGLDNRLTGNSGNNRLDGGGGSDRMAGGAGDDTYLVDHGTDQVLEYTGNGTDTVLASASFTLGKALENLILTGTADVNGTGNGLANRLTGNSGNNRLDGGGGGDTLAGGAGDDMYIVDNAGDGVREYTEGGNDTVVSALSWTLGKALENLQLTGSANTAATGNGLDNRLTGNAGGNTLNGLGGNDWLEGGLGNDTYLFARGGGADTVRDTDATASNRDVLSFQAGIDAGQLWFRKVDKNLEISLIGTTDKVTVQGWYYGAQNQVEELHTADGRVLASAQVNRLVTAMAALTPPPPGQTTLDAVRHAALDSVIAAAWS
jgi:serralysin